MEKPKKREPARLVVELPSRRELELLHARARRLDLTLAQWVRSLLRREMEQ